MNRDEMLDRGAQAMFEAHDPGHAKQRPPGRWAVVALHMYRSRLITGLGAIETEIRADAAKAERERIAAWLRSLKSHQDTIGIYFAAQMIEEGKLS